VNGMNRVGEIAAPAAFGTPRALFKEQVAAAPTALPSYWLLARFPGPALREHTVPSARR
jgi:hypothetical protein